MEEIIYAQTTETLSETLTDTTEVEDTSLSFGTILFATLTPTLFIVIVYLLMKFFSGEKSK
jgi:hypothetical protein